MKHLILILALFSISALAEPTFNPMSGKWENAGSDDELRYNPHSDEWSYEDEDAELEYSPLYEDDEDDSGWEWNDGDDD